jgi:hypothetical protein
VNTISTLAHKVKKKPCFWAFSLIHIEIQTPPKGLVKDARDKIGAKKKINITVTSRKKARKKERKERKMGRNSETDR